MTAQVVLNCKHSRQIRDTDPDWVYCMDCFHAVYIGGPPLPFVHGGVRVARIESNGKEAKVS